ncbi:PBP1b-binding outer membrane lipoprotein LpoB [Oikeobacillus pervagus]|uniref:PBP1b-binding outer membrane lipoprotein LpoB n=1 Tax=Oikeobacillus pervagus TaxID=1325931 RepID=A0AAJ1T3F7_9BACI|nr:hypothetical protein [Oikeobacillus pervagus]MDQ0215214.1 PBP1b-binding outer membrane lipoprotein LpoB [Oikeobacillus pervagus]
MKKTFLLFLLLFMVTGCKQQYPEPESQKDVPKVDAAIVNGQNSLNVRHTIQGNQIFIECIVPHITFTNGKKGHQRGKIVVSIDGKRYKEYNTAAFIIKGVDKGPHHIKIDVLTYRNQPLGLSKEFYMTIP